MNTREKKQRRIFLVKREFQFRYLRIVVSILLLFAFVVGSTIYMTTWHILAKESLGDFADARLSNIFSRVNLIILIETVFLVFLAGITSIYLSHRIAGPLYKIENNLRSIGRGNLMTRVALRKNDELKDLAEEINSMVTGVSEMILSDRKKRDQIVHKIKGFKDDLKLNRLAFGEKKANGVKMLEQIIEQASTLTESCVIQPMA